MSSLLPPTWHWDEIRREYYFWDAHDNCHVYERSGRIYASEASSEQAVLSNVEEGPAEQITEEIALQSGIRAHKKLRETPGETERLDPRYQKHYPGRGFYRPGKVFKVLWPEPAGNPQSGVTFITGSYGEPIYDKIRWFVVIREGRDCCTCLPIQTYNRQGVAKPGVIKTEHSVVHTGSAPPPISASEDPYGEMLHPIPVVPRNPAEAKMDPMSRLNYAKPYTVEHNVKSLDFGDVPAEWLPTLRQNFVSVLQLGHAGLPSTPRHATVPVMPLSPPDASSPASYLYPSSPTSNRGYSHYPGPSTGAGVGSEYFARPDGRAEHTTGYYRGGYGYPLGP